MLAVRRDKFKDPWLPKMLRRRHVEDLALSKTFKTQGTLQNMGQKEYEGARESGIETSKHHFLSMVQP